jgi:tetratricopeptide (TPR) repeat protein
MADIYEARGELDSAIDALKDALRRQPALISAHTKLVSLATAKKDWPQARAAAREVQKRFPKEARGYHLEGLVYAAQQQWGPALASFRAAATHGESSELTLQMHTALRALGKSPDAERLAEQWLAKRPKDDYFIGYLGETALVMRDFATAEKHFRSVLAHDPRSVDAMNNLAWALIEQSKPGALELARKAAQLQPRRVDVLDTLSNALAIENQLPEAVSNQKRAVALAPQQPALRLNLARLAIKAGDHPLARTELDKLSALGKAYPEQAEVWKLRQQLP